MAGFLGRLANPRVLAAALVGGAAAAGVSYHMSNGAWAGAAGEMRKASHKLFATKSVYINTSIIHPVAKIDKRRWATRKG